MNITKWKQLLVSLVVLALAATCFVPMSKAEAAGNDPIDVNASAAIMIEASSGKILYSKNADKRLPIASMTKMMTEYLLLEAIKEGKVKWDQTYTPDDYVYEISQDNSLSNVPFEKTANTRLKNCIRLWRFTLPTEPRLQLPKFLPELKRNLSLK